VARLPKPLATLYEKLNVFAKHYPQFNLSVKAKGLDTGASDSHPEIDRVYQNYDTQVLYNPTNLFKVLRKMRHKGPNTEAKEVKPSPRISDHSKRIKKDKKAATSKKEASE